mgnify:CR=1 FL=1
MVSKEDFATILGWFRFQELEGNGKVFSIGEPVEEAGVVVYPSDGLFKGIVKTLLRQVFEDKEQYKELCKSLKAEAVNIRHGRVRVFRSFESWYGTNVWWNDTLKK